jgi:hypothetical protein
MYMVFVIYVIVSSVSVVSILVNINVAVYVSELYDGCLCANCLLDLQKEYQEGL